jgi:CheY-like chemotaxis protein
MSKDPRVRSNPQRFENLPPMPRDEVNGPPSLFLLVERMLSLDPKFRFQTPSQLLDAVQDLRREIEAGGSNGDKKAARSTVRSVFVVEREQKLQDAMREGFGKLGYRVLLAANPDIALDRYRQQPFDAIVLDAGSVGEEGRFVFERILKEAEVNTVPCAGILILSEDQKRWAREIKNGQNVSVMVRPLTLKQLQTKLMELVPQAVPT